MGARRGAHESNERPSALPREVPSCSSATRVKPWPGADRLSLNRSIQAFLCNENAKTPMSPHAILFRSYSPDLSIEFDLVPGTHARIGASPAMEVTLPLTGIAPFWCTIGRFQDGRLFLADKDGLITKRIDLPETFPLPPYQFVACHPDDTPPVVPLAEDPAEPKKPLPLATVSLVTGVLVVVGLAAAVAMNQCGKPASVSSAAPKSTIPQSAEPTPAPPVMTRPQATPAPAPK